MWYIDESKKYFKKGSEKIMKILLAIDGSDNAFRAAEFTANLAEMIPGSRVTLVFVDTLATIIKSRGGTLPEDYESIINEEIAKLFKRAENLFAEKSIPYNIKILEGYDVAETICDYAKEYNYDQIIMGTRGLGSIKGIILGSVSHKVIQLAPCPVTFVK
ncbi:MAG TPA: universal stress protein [Peptococcaceae bacterium]|nr:universal stress protein [Peptococcaceae bacterium]